MEEERWLEGEGMMSWFDSSLPKGFPVGEQSGEAGTSKGLAPPPEMPQREHASHSLDAVWGGHGDGTRKCSSQEFLRERRQQTDPGRNGMSHASHTDARVAVLMRQKAQLEQDLALQKEFCMQAKEREKALEHQKESIEMDFARSEARAKGSIEALRRELLQSEERASVLMEQKEASQRESNRAKKEVYRLLEENSSLVEEKEAVERDLARLAEEHKSLKGQLQSLRKTDMVETNGHRRPAPPLRDEGPPYDIVVVGLEGSGTTAMLEQFCKSVGNAEGPKKLRWAKENETSRVMVPIPFQGTELRVLKCAGKRQNYSSIRSDIAKTKWLFVVCQPSAESKETIAFLEHFLRDAGEKGCKVLVICNTWSVQRGQEWKVGQMEVKDIKNRYRCLAVKTYSFSYALTKVDLDR
uniref:Uncharacterized protein n=1 Tax=Chromera velia CCMP2878 TaxID=1169474 RepID=A0A0G4F9M6_9ALVE|mmetsp:Transcript_17236/g.34965  ORF Transcript_17236/g.34965 Transcript_17236/m.34965 type:complete len:411 (-) Transcript_17236:124-1356(-)|eukprot:Cvel_15913.t1-p1 / transcript=Cvel_15913.t1 / gene=Cvel_15913 / organism=Chromera_velia_CCMP2878 / gene_product=Coiled-coil domain-containing protein 153, putative / transcript_product=Coiled-coil domain-containing protein 153, putative / location=Cvel_scaffold1203:10829-13230(+) / protein_length=410 / sequence_SO=supercontig / SO=protein_coding / is_pseudo=false